MTDLTDKEKARIDFVNEMYQVYWANQARSMDGVWKVLAPITVAASAIVGAHKDYLPAPIGIAFAIAVVFWALNVTIDLNAWHRRNLYLVTKVERSFLTADDYGNLLPKKYRTAKPGWITFYKINLAIFLVLLGLTVAYALVWDMCPQTKAGWWLPIAVFVVGTGYTLCQGREQESSSKALHHELFESSGGDGDARRA